jgi:hypothetical protein
LETRFSPRCTDDCVTCTGNEWVAGENLSPTGGGIAPFRMKQPKRRLDEQYQLAGAGGIEPPNGGIKISLIIQRIQCAFGKNPENPL